MRRERPVRLEYYRAYWRGNGGPIHDLAASRGDVYCGSEVIRSGGAFAGTAEQVRSRFARWLAECGATAAESAAALEGLIAAHAVFAGWAEEADAAVAAELAEIVAHGEPPR